MDLPARSAGGPSLTRAQEDHLKALYNLHGDTRPVLTGELAQRLGISAASVSDMVARLSDLGLVRHDRYRGQILTGAGQGRALELVRHHRLLEIFLVQVLGYTWDEVHEEAELLEHVMSERMEDRIFELLGRPELDPHGHAIPSREGTLRVVNQRALSDCQGGEEVVVAEVSDEDPDLLRELDRRGLIPGARLSVIGGTKYESPIEAELNEQRVSVPLGLARTILVREPTD
ncbi:MAG TPA: metal-dependent transcriptional regulator [Candidatus Dormibacteraeota bacterium]|jgi:DtxR family Mn-dependent transcriptional regulator|nr:metal-dependent transcriptional regulator [Candidatus Dormibacteraeota bacterium]